ncbi:virulence transcriptional regulatory protein PhoP [bacterium BMS3Bbin11]|nr:virulence transcriptional regulatory protein PhoP [bacterium BMS3Abin11]GBE45786.1 virulence transcriptional regulatory protein PhoP [bacterium BMS3Bbin11]HDH16861.1 response regulator transcription factor [Gammaproteobacteria bacterium]HDZ78842.1 response regulator transcription factor [Gammaproteobacteria bacterium]
MRILIIEDEKNLREQLLMRLQRQGYAVDAASDGEEGLFLAMEHPFDAAVIDLGLPKLSGIEVIRQLRSQGSVLPILILTARSRWEEKVEGLEAGGDDYLAKPFHIEELQARLRALIRRSVGSGDSEMRCGPITLNTRKQSITVDGKELELTAYEYKVIEYLMLHAGEVVSKTLLTEHIYDQDFDLDSNVIEVFIGRLRKKLDPENIYKPIETLRGRGYRFTLSSESWQ